MIKIICVGKLKEKYLIDLVYDYLSRLNKYHKTEIVEIKDSDIYKESLLIEKQIDNRDFVTDRGTNKENEKEGSPDIYVPKVKEIIISRPVATGRERPV